MPKSKERIADLAKKEINKYEFYEARKRKSFSDSSRLEGIIIDDKPPSMSMSDVLEKYGAKLADG